MVKGRNGTLKVDNNCTILKAISIIYQNKVTALAIVNGEGTLIGTLSATDLGVSRIQVESLFRRL